MKFLTKEELHGIILTIMRAPECGSWRNEGKKAEKVVQRLLVKKPKGCQYSHSADTAVGTVASYTVRKSEEQLGSDTGTLQRCHLEPNHLDTFFH